MRYSPSSGGPPGCGGGVPQPVLPLLLGGNILAVYSQAFHSSGLTCHLSERDASWGGVSDPGPGDDPKLPALAYLSI